MTRPFSAASKTTQRRMTTALREAVWRAHGKRDAFTGEPLDWSELQIDHVIAVTTTPDELLDLMARGLVPQGFDILGPENLLPTRTFRNRQKSDRPLGDAALHFFLDLARDAAPKVNAYLADDRASERSLDAYLLLQKEAERNAVSLEELLDMKRHQVDGDVRIGHHLAVKGAEDIAYASREIAAELLQRPFALGGGHIHEVRLQNDDNEVRICRTGEEFLAAKDAGFWALTQYDMNMNAWAESTSEFLRAVRDSDYAPNSRIRTPKVTFEDLDRWSARWIIGNWNDPDEDGIAKARLCRTIADCVAAGLCEIKSQGRTEIDLAVKYGFSLRLADLLRADLDHDDDEEVLVYSVSYAEGGTFRAGAVEIAKCDAEGLLQPPWEPQEWG